MSVDFQAIVKGEGLEYEVAQKFQYPGGELHLKEIAKHNEASTIWSADVRGADLNDLGYAALLADVAHSHNAPFVLLLPYLPAGRADHVGSGDPLGVKVYADIVNSMNPQQVIGIDPHSSVVNRYMRNLTAVDPWPLTVKAMMEAHPGEMPYTTIIAPDHGALGRAGSLAATYGIGYVAANKERDFDTGRITGIGFPDNVSLNARGRYLIVDDICDGGGTFIGLAEHLRDKHGIDRDQLGLWVTHGIFSGKAPTLRGYFDHIYTTDSHPGHSRPGVATTVVHVDELLRTTIKEFG